MDTNCPYCDAEVEINHDDGYGYEEDVRHEQYCSVCDKHFVFTTTISFSYETEKANCLNGDEHEYKKTHTVPKEFSKMRCIMCDKEREMTDKERDSFGIGSKESHFEKNNQY